MLKLSITLPNSAQINLESEDSVVIDKILGTVLADVTRALLAMPGGADAGPTPVPARDAGLSIEHPTDPPPPIPAAAPQPAATAAGEVELKDLLPTDSGAGSSLADAAGNPEVDTDTDLFSGGPEFADDRELLPAAPDFVLDTSPDSTPDSGLATWVREAVPESRPAPHWQTTEALEGATARPNGFPSMAGGPAPPSNVMPAVSEQAFVDFCRAANPLGDMRRVVVAAEGASRYLAMDGVDAESLGRLFDTVGWPRAHNFVQTLRNAARSKFGWLERIPGRAGHYSVTDLGRSTALGR